MVTLAFTEKFTVMGLGMFVPFFHFRQHRYNYQRHWDLHGRYNGDILDIHTEAE